MAVKDPAAREVMFTMLAMLRTQGAALQSSIDANDARHDATEEKVEGLSEHAAELEEKARGTACLLNLTLLP